MSATGSGSTRSGASWASRHRRTTAGWTATDGHPSRSRRTRCCSPRSPRSTTARAPPTARRGGTPPLLRRGVRVSRKRVERLMREAGLQGACVRGGEPARPGRTRPRQPARDLVDRDFTAPAPNRLWVADATRIPCAQGVFWLAAVRDAFSNRIVGWRCSDCCDTDLILGALEYAVWSRGIRDGQVVHHSDRGSNYVAALWSTPR
ncbi:DDE-type integrase/transposase/recombinase [Pseudonocardia sp. CA-142604]|uniref:DDE-type integrase/transposase/recombinase n=1 Tax=Pseudonocardia sp. CA-142604 TaxID=3240024 RepID=UPI003D931E3F